GSSCRSRRQSATQVRPGSYSRLGFVSVAEGAAERALHDRLLAFERDFGVITLAERAVAIAGQQVPYLAEAHFLVGLGVSASDDIKVESLIAGFQDLHLERAIGGPKLIELDEVSHRGDPIWGTFCKLLALGDGRLADCGIENG